MKKVFIAFALLLVAACHQHRNDSAVQSNATKFSEHVWPGVVKQVVCGPCPCREGQDVCDGTDVVTCMVTTSHGDEQPQLHILVCPAVYSFPCDISSSWEETHRK